MAEYTTTTELDEAPLPLDGIENIYCEPLIAGERKGRRFKTNNILYHPVLTVRDRGYVSGFDIYKVANQEICIRPGVRYFTDGTNEYVIEKTDFQSIAAGVINALTASKWYGVFMDYQGTVAIDTTPLTGAVTERPTDNFYGWVDGDNTKYRHDRQGYYKENYLCIGTLWLDASKYVSYIINQLSGSHEIGENSLGKWDSIGNNNLYPGVGTLHAITTSLTDWMVAGATDVYTSPGIWNLSGLIPVGTKAVEVFFMLNRDPISDYDSGEGYMWDYDRGAYSFNTVYYFGLHVRVSKMVASNFTFNGLQSNMSGTIKLSGNSRKLYYGRNAGASFYRIFAGLTGYYI